MSDINEPERDSLRLLRLDDAFTRERPNPEFAAWLRATLADQFDPTPQDGTMATHAPNAKLHAITPYLCAHDGPAAIAWYTEYLGARLEGTPFSMDGTPFTDASKVGHAELWFGDSVVYLSDEWPEGGVLSPKTLGGAGAALVLAVPTPGDVDEVFERAVKHGATAQRQPADQFHGSRAGWLIDPFGFRWNVTSPIVASESEAVHASEPFTAADLWNEVGYYTIAVAEPFRAQAFYNAVFGWQLPAPAQDGPFFGMHNETTHIPMGFTNATEERNPRLYFRVRDINVMCDRVVASGGSVVHRDQYGSGENAVCRDDQGTEFDLWQPAPGY